jgi:hypothetical protein
MKAQPPATAVTLAEDPLVNLATTPLLTLGPERTFNDVADVVTVSPTLTAVTLWSAPREVVHPLG